MEKNKQRNTDQNQQENQDENAEETESAMDDEKEEELLTSTAIKQKKLDKNYYIQMYENSNYDLNDNKNNYDRDIIDVENVIKIANGFWRVIKKTWTKNVCQKLFNRVISNVKGRNQRLMIAMQCDIKTAKKYDLINQLRALPNVSDQLLEALYNEDNNDNKMEHDLFGEKMQELIKQINNKKKEICDWQKEQNDVSQTIQQIRQQNQKNTEYV